MKASFLSRGFQGGFPLTSCVWLAKCDACGKSGKAAPFPGTFPKKLPLLSPTGLYPACNSLLNLQIVVVILPFGRGIVQHLIPVQALF